MLENPIDTPSSKAQENKESKQEDSRFRPAKSIDFVEGKILYVRGGKAICRRFEYPLVYWTFQGEDIEKHRSFLVNPDMFSVLKEEQEDEPDRKDSEHAIVISKQKNQELRPEVKLGKGLHLSACEDCTITLTEQVAFLKLTNCVRVNVSFVAASNCELIKSSACLLVCQSICATYLFDDSHSCRIVFPKNAVEQIQWLTSKSSKNILEAQTSSDAEKPVIFEIPEQGDNLRTIYDKGIFKTETYETNGTS